jgi:hypothetical protein
MQICKKISGIVEFRKKREKEEVDIKSIRLEYQIRISD